MCSQILPDHINVYMQLTLISDKLIRSCLPVVSRHSLGRKVGMYYVIHQIYFVQTSQHWVVATSLSLKFCLAGIESLNVTALNDA